MKFDKFVKNTGTMGAIVEYGGQKYLCSGPMIARIPEGITGLACAVATELPERLRRILEESEEEEAYLSDAFLPQAGDKPTELRRVFSDRLGHCIDISNKQFGLIEKCDGLAVLLQNLDDQTYAAALKIYDVNHEVVYAYIFSEKYLNLLKLYEEEQVQ